MSKHKNLTSCYVNGEPIFAYHNTTDTGLIIYSVILKGVNQYFKYTTGWHKSESLAVRVTSYHKIDRGVVLTIQASLNHTFFNVTPSISTILDVALRMVGFNIVDNNKPDAFNW